MKGDFSRPASLDARKRRYTAVLMQQGRVTLDADWNEQQQIHRYHRETGMSDLIGASGAPADNAGFEITVDNDNVLTIGPGRYYVDGILAELDQPTGYHEQPYLADPPAAQDSAPDALAMLAGTQTGLGLVYLDVWPRHVTALDDPAIREPALGGPDTTTRAETQSQVRILPIDTERGDIQRLQLSLRWQTELEIRLVAIELLATLERRLEEIFRGAGRHAAEFTERETAFPAVQLLKEIQARLRQRVAGLHADLIEFYRSEENERAFKALRGIEIELEGLMRQLHTRIQELVRTDADRDAIVALRHTRGELERLVRELELHPRPHGEQEDEELQRIRRDFLRAARRLHARVPDLRERELDRAAVTAYRDTRRELAQTSQQIARQAVSVCGSQLDEWDALTQGSTGMMQARVERTSGPLGFRQPDNQLIRMEIHEGSDGLNGPSFKWARDNASVVAGVERIEGPKVIVLDLGPDEERSFAPGQWAEIVDERTALNAQPGTLARIVDVDPAARTLTLDLELESVSPEEAGLSNLQVRRWNGAGPVEPGAWAHLDAGIQVRFDEGTYGTGDHWSIVTRSDGIEWQTPSEDGSQPLGPNSVEHHHARLGLIALHDDAVVPLADGRKQFGAIAEPAPAIHVDEVMSQNGRPLANDGDLPVTALAQGISIVCDENLDPATISRATCFVTLELPYEFPGADRANAATGNNPIGFVPLILAANEPIAVEDGTIQWQPSEDTAGWLERALFFTVARDVDRVLARLTLKGNVIWNRLQGENAEPEMCLDGEVFGRPSHGLTELRLPSGDGRPGGDFEMWFWVSEVRNVTLQVNPATVAGQATVEGTVSLSGPAPREDATIRLRSNEGHAVVPESVTIQAGQSSATFQIEALAVNRVTEAEISATYEPGETTTQTLKLDPLLRVAGLRILDTLTDPGESDFAGESFEVTSGLLSKSPINVPVRRPNMVEVRFDNASLDGGSALIGRTVKMETLTGTSSTWTEVPGRIDVRPDSNLIRWMAHSEGLANMLEELLSFSTNLLHSSRQELDAAAREGAAPPLPEGQYRFTLAGDGAPAITSLEGHRLDGEAIGLPSGDQVEGGDFTISLHIRGQGRR